MNEENWVTRAMQRERTIKRSEYQRSPTEKQLAKGRRRRRIEDILEAAALERNALLEVWELGT